MSLPPKKKRSRFSIRKEKKPPEMVLVEKKKLEAITQAQVGINAQPVPRVEIAAQQPPATKVIVIDREIQKAKVELQELRAKHKENISNMTPKSWKRQQELEAQVAAAELGHKEAESEQSGE